jgi:hypothetical protein
VPSGFPQCPLWSAFSFSFSFSFSFAFSFAVAVRFSLCPLSFLRDLCGQLLLLLLLLLLPFSFSQRPLRLCGKGSSALSTSA